MLARPKKVSRRMYKRPLKLLLGSYLFWNVYAYADQFYFVSPGSTVWNGAYVNSYTGNDMTQPQSNPITIFCDDWNTDFSGNPTWNANVYALTSANLLNLRFGADTDTYNVVDNGSGGASDHLSIVKDGSSDQFTRYLEAAWLDEQWLNAVGTHTATPTMQIELAVAQWTLFVDAAHVGGPSSDPTSGLVGAINASGYADAVSTYLKDAQDAVMGGYDAQGWDVIVPVDDSVPIQEFLTRDAPSAVPEPDAIFLLITVIACLAVPIVRRVSAARVHK